VKGDKMNNNDPFKQIRQMNLSARLASDQRALNRRRDESYAAGRRTTEATLRRMRDEADAQRRRESFHKASLSRQENEGLPRSSGSGHKAFAVFLVIVVILFGVFAAFVLLGLGILAH
jgi:hypothetical protein